MSLESERRPGELPLLTVAGAGRNVTEANPDEGAPDDIMAWSRASYVLLSVFSWPRTSEHGVWSWVRRLVSGTLMLFLAVNWVLLAAKESEPYKTHTFYYISVLSMNLLPVLSIVAGFFALTPTFLKQLTRRLWIVYSYGGPLGRGVERDISSVWAYALLGIPVYMTAVLSYQIFKNNDGPGMGKLGTQMNRFGFWVGPGKYAAPLVHTSMLIVLLRAYKRELALFAAAHTERADAHLEGAFGAHELGNGIVERASDVLSDNTRDFQAAFQQATAQRKGLARRLCCGEVLCSICCDVRPQSPLRAQDVWSHESEARAFCDLLVEKELTVRRRLVHVLSQSTMSTFTSRHEGGSLNLIDEVDETVSEGSQTVLDEEVGDVGYRSGSGSVRSRSTSSRRGIDVHGSVDRSTAFILAHKNIKRFYRRTFHHPAFQAYVTVTLVLNLVMLVSVAGFLLIEEPSTAVKIEEKNSTLELVHVLTEWLTLLVNCLLLMIHIARANAAHESLKSAINSSVKASYDSNERIITRQYLLGLRGVPFRLLGGFGITYRLLGKSALVTMTTVLFGTFRFIHAYHGIVE